MDAKTIAVSVVSIAIACLFAVTLLIPVIADSTTTEDTFTNEGVFNYGKFTPDDEYTLTFDCTTGTIKVGDDTVTPIDGVSLTSFLSYSVIATDNVLLRWGANQSGYYMQLIGNDSGGNNVLSGGATGTATISSGNLSVTVVSSENVSATKTFTFTELYAIVPDDDVAVLKVSADAVYINGDSELYGSGLTTVTSWNNMFHFEGTYDDGITISSPNLSNATFDNITWTIEPVAGYIDLYKLTKIEFDITSNDTTVHATYSFFGVPSEVTAERSIHPDANTSTLLNIIPLFVVIGIILGTIGIIAMRK